MPDKALVGVVALILLAVPALSLAAVDPNIAVEPVVRAYFASRPVMIDIADCESQFKQFNDDGSVLHGGDNDTMTGIFQIAHLHREEALEHHFDIDTIAGNIAYATYLYDQEGTTPWLDSSDCWDKSSAVASAASSTPVATTMSDRDAQIAFLKQEIVQLTAKLQALLAARKAS